MSASGPARCDDLDRLVWSVCAAAPEQAVEVQPAVLLVLAVGDQHDGVDLGRIEVVTQRLVTPRTPCRTGRCRRAHGPATPSPPAAARTAGDAADWPPSGPSGTSSFQSLGGPVLRERPQPTYVLSASSHRGQGAVAATSIRFCRRHGRGHRPDTSITASVRPSRCTTFHPQHGADLRGGRAAAAAGSRPARRPCAPARRRGALRSRKPAR